jgi:hypothetical protein
MVVGDLSLAGEYRQLLASEPSVAGTLERVEVDYIQTSSIIVHLELSTVNKCS